MNERTALNLKWPLLALILFSVSALAEGDGLTSKDFRGSRQWLVAVNYSYIDLLIPSKFGVTAAYVHSAADTFEIEYMRGSLGFGWLGFDIGKVTDQRVSVLWRSFAARNSFNFQLGASYNKVDVRIGDSLLAKVTGAPGLDYTAMSFETLGASIGVGHRFQDQRGLVWSFDWLQVVMPLITLREKSDFIEATPDAGDRENAREAAKWIRNLPRLVVLKAQIGFTF